MGGQEGRAMHGTGKKPDIASTKGGSSALFWRGQIISWEAQFVKISRFRLPYDLGGMHGNLSNTVLAHGKINNLLNHRRWGHVGRYSAGSSPGIRGTTAPLVAFGMHVLVGILNARTMRCC